VSFAYNDIAADLLYDWETSNPDPGNAERTADAIIAALSMTRLREYLVLHLTIDRVPDAQVDEAIAGFDLGELQPQRPARGPEGPRPSYDIADESAAPLAAAVGQIR
jgi:hypothetical protein